MKTINAAIVATSLLLSAPLHAGKFVIMPEYGRGDIDMKEDMGAAAGAGNNLSVSVTSGYKFDSNVILAASYGYAESDGSWFFGAFDNYRVVELTALVGYSINLAKHFRLVPSVGLSSWSLEGSEGMFLNPGDEEKVEMDGTDPYAKLNAEIPINNLVSLNLSYTYGEYDFGSMKTTRFGVKFEF